MMVLKQAQLRSNVATVRLVPVQITIPAQQGNPQSQPRALTVQVKTNRVRVRAT